MALGLVRSGSFATKLVAATGLAVLADRLFFWHWIGGTLGAFALVWALALLIAVRPVRRRLAALTALLGAIYFGMTLVDNPGLLNWVLFWTLLTSAALLSRRRFDDAVRWAQRLLLSTVFGLVQPMADAWKLFHTPGRRGGVSPGRLLSILAVPVIGGTVFVSLFAGANPLIGELFARIEIGSPFWLVPHTMFAGLVLALVWPSFRPHRTATRTDFFMPTLGFVPQVPMASVTLSLLTFNAIFAVQNVLDLIFLWSGAPLPGTVTLADYAHRGAYLLIATALLAGLFVLTMLRPGSDSARNPAIRALVTLWVAQNLLLVASSMLRLFDYIAAYSLTELRIAALAWMALVGIGLTLILWRLIGGKSSAWLINANALAAGLVLAGSCATDFGEIAARWNVRHAREAGGSGAEIDLCYLRWQGPAALNALVELEGKVKDPGLLDRVRAVRWEVLDLTGFSQAHWDSWTWRNARRLAAAQAALGPNPALPARARWGRACDGSPLPQPEAVEPAGSEARTASASLSPAEANSVAATSNTLTPEQR